LPRRITSRLLAASSSGRRAQLPSHLAAALAAVMGSPVDTVVIIEHAWMARLHGRWVSATTRRGRIYLRGSAAHFFQSPELLLHEYCHVLRQWEPGRLTLTRYVIESLRRGYFRNRFEVEAREFAARHVGRLQDLLQQRPR
jgi:hypothetical protein